jgi:hypothetical protein
MAKHTVVVELYYDDDWNAADVYTRDGIRIVHGRADEQAQAGPSSCELTLQNRDATYNPRNPESTLYGKIGRNTPVRVTVDGAVRFAGEVAEWRPRRALDDGDAWVALTCNGVSRRLGQGASPAPAALRTHLAALSDVSYWPMEAGPLTQESPALVGPGGPVRLNGRPAPSVWGQGRLASWMPNVAKIEPKDAGATLRADVEQADFVDRWAFDFMRSGGYGATVGGTVAGVGWGDSATGITFNALDSEIDLFYGFTDLATVSVDPTLWDDNPHHVRLAATQDGADIDYEVFIDGVSVLTHTDTGETLSRMIYVSNTASITIETAYVTGHWVAHATPSNLAAAVEAAFGYPGEAAGRRIEAECPVAFTSTGDLDDTTPLGPQYADPTLEILQEAADADLGILHDAVTAVGLHYRTRASIQNQSTPAVLALGFTAGHVAPTMEPATDDQHVRNDVTAKRREGGERRVVDEDGPLGTDAIGRYDTSVTVNVPGDGFLESQAGWRLHLGTAEDDRWPRLSVDLDAAPSLAADAADVRPGDLITLSDLPDTIAGPDLAKLIVQGWTEAVDSHRRIITFNCSPAGPWQVGEYEAAEGDANKYDTAGSVLDADGAGESSSATFIDVDTVIEPIWTTDPDEFPFDINVGGERMTVTAIAGAGTGQTFTVTRSVNGVVKAHAAGTPVSLWNPARYGL